MLGLHKESSANNESSKGDFEVYALGVESGFLDSGLSYIARERLLYITYAVIYIFSGTLRYHFNSSVRQVADRTG